MHLVLPRPSGPGGRASALQGLGRHVDGASLPIETIDAPDWSGNDPPAGGAIAADPACSDQLPLSNLRLLVIQTSVQLPDGCMCGNDPCGFQLPHTFRDICRHSDSACHFSALQLRSEAGWRYDTLSLVSVMSDVVSRFWPQNRRDQRANR